MVLGRLDEILAQRMTDPVLGHQDSAHVAVPFEIHAEQIEDLALHPVRRLPHVSRVATLGLSRGSFTFSTAVCRFVYENR